MAAKASKNKTPASERKPRETLSAKVARLEATLAERDATIARLEARSTASPADETTSAHAELLRLAGERIASLETKLREASTRSGTFAEILTSVEERTLEREAAFEVVTRELVSARERLARLEGEDERAALFEEAAADSGLALLALEQEVAVLRSRLRQLEAAGQRAG